MGGRKGRLNYFSHQEYPMEASAAALAVGQHGA